MSKVQFCRCTEAEYSQLDVVDGILYFITDTNKVFLDSVEVSNNDLSDLLGLSELKNAVDERLHWGTNN